MRLKVTFAVPPGISPATAQLLLQGQELEADGYHVDPRNGSLTITKLGAAPGVVDAIVVYAAGVWRSIADVGAWAAAVRKPSEDTGRPQEARQARTA